jgi:phosphoserine phosphatase
MAAAAGAAARAGAAGLCAEVAYAGPAEGNWPPVADGPPYTAGRRLVLATASNEYYVAAIASLLGMDDVIATASRWEDDRLHHRLGGDNCYGEVKRVLVEAFLERERLAGAPIYFYSDHHSDAPVFALAEETGGAAIATNASPKLRALAQLRGWQIVDWGPPERSWFERA